MAGGAIGVVGKLPDWADFVRLGARGPAFERLLTWLVDGAESAAACGRTEFGALAGGDVQAFVYAGEGGTLLAGALTPSQDRAGRCVPVAAAREVMPGASLVRHPEALPIVLEAVWARTGRLVIELQEATRESLPEEGWSADVELEAEAALEIYREWTREISLEDFLELVFAGDAGRAAETFATVEEAILPHRGRETPATSLALRLPLGTAGGAAVCFWLDLARRLARWERTIPSFFWSHDGGSGVLMLHLGFVSETALAELWLPTVDRDEICDLMAPGPPRWRSDRLAAWSAELDRPERSLVTLLDAAQFGI